MAYRKDWVSRKSAARVCWHPQGHGKRIIVTAADVSGAGNIVCVSVPPGFVVDGC